MGLTLHCHIAYTFLIISTLMSLKRPGCLHQHTPQSYISFQKCRSWTAYSGSSSVDTIRTVSIDLLHFRGSHLPSAMPSYHISRHSRSPMPHWRLSLHLLSHALAIVMASIYAKCDPKASLAWATSALRLGTKQCGKKQSNTIEIVQS